MKEGGGKGGLQKAKPPRGRAGFCLQNIQTREKKK